MAKTRTGRTPQSTHGSGDASTSSAPSNAPKTVPVIRWTRTLQRPSEIWLQHDHDRHWNPVSSDQVFAGGEQAADGGRHAKPKSMAKTAGTKGDIVPDFEQWIKRLGSRSEPRFGRFVKLLMS